MAGSCCQPRAPLLPQPHRSSDSPPEVVLHCEEAPTGCCARPSATPSPCCSSSASASPPAAAATAAVAAAPATASTATASCTDGCCQAPPPQPSLIKDDDSLVKPDCCHGKSSPCCDDDCLDRLALRECDAASTSSPCAGETQKCAAVASSPPCCESGPQLECSGETKRRACDRHRRAARERYSATLEAIGCICRALIAIGQESCCDTRKRSLERKRAVNKSSNRSLRRSSDSCCAVKRVVGPEKGVGSCRTKCATRVERECTSQSCCETAKPQLIKASCPDACCAAPEEPKAGKDTLKDPISNAQDVENQAAGHDHVVLCISGMTCTSCETKLKRTLATVAGVKNLKTSLVLSRAEFDVDLRLTAVDDVVKHLERTTEFKCERITNNGSSLDIIVPGDPTSFINQPWPNGVVDMSLVDKHVLRISFDPKMVGARDLIEKHWGQSVTLAPLQSDVSVEAGSKHVRHVGYMTLLSAAFTIPVLVMAWAPLPEREIAYASASLALATIVQVFIAGPFYPTALKALVFSRVIEMDLLIVLSTSAAFIFSVVSFAYLVAGKPLSTGQFFETSTLLVTLIMVGRYVAALARQKAVESISVRSLQTQTALLANDSDSETREIDARLLQYGDVFKVLPDAKVPTDGTVITGSSEVDESMLTGESRPVEKHAQSPVIAGTINGSGTLIVRLTRLPGENTINAIAVMVDEAKLSKPKMQDLADRVASYFVPLIVTLTVITFVVWVAIGIAVRGKTGSDATVQALTYAITVLIVSCPCAIGLAVPMVVVIASGVAAERGVIFKSADAIEVAYRSSEVVFDKTGTLTQGKLSVAAEHCIRAGEASLSLLLGLIANSRHPVSVAVANHLRGNGVVASAVPETKSLTGQGLEAQVAGQTLRAGNSRWLDVASHAVVQPLVAQGYTVFCFTIDDSLAAVYGLEDSVRADARHVISVLQGRGVSVHVVSGDDDGAVRNVAAKLGIPEHNAHARSSPSDKQAYVQSLLGDASNDKKPVVVFCGDGTNDAIALAQATIGVHMSEGSDVAQSAADVVLMRPDLSGILTMINASEKSVRRIKFNFAWSLVYNVSAILLAAGAFVNARIPPKFGGLGELVSVLPVIIAAVLLRWAKI